MNNDLIREHELEIIKRVQDIGKSMRTTDIQIKEIIYKWHNLEADINELRDETTSWIETNHLADMDYLLRCINELCDVFKVNRRI